MAAFPTIEFNNSEVSNTVHADTVLRALSYRPRAASTRFRGSVDRPLWFYLPTMYTEPATGEIFEYRRAITALS